MALPSEKNLSAFIDPATSEKFSEQAGSRGHIKRRAVEGAIRLWISLPTELQSRIIESSDSDIADIYSDLGNRLREALRNALVHEKPKKKKKKA